MDDPVRRLLSRSDYSMHGRREASSSGATSTRQLHAFDAETGTALRNPAPPEAPIQTGTIACAADGKQYLTVANSNALISPSRIGDIGSVTLPPHQGNSINIFALRK